MQETHLRNTNSFNIRGFRGYRCDDDDPDRRAKGGVAILIKESISSKNIPINTHLQAVAVEVIYPIKFTICNIYLPKQSWNLNDIRNSLRQLPTPFLVVGDFNCHNPLWGSTRLDNGGIILEQAIEDFNLIVLNSGSGTYLNSRSNNFTAIDIFCSPALSTHFNWTTLDAYLYSDHFPICLSLSTTQNQLVPITTKWQLNKADWEKYEDIIKLPELADDIDSSVSAFTEALIVAAHKATPQSVCKRTKKTVPWWNKEIEQAIRAKKKALNHFKKHSTQEYMITFKRERARARRLIRENKKLSWQTYINTLRADTPSGEVWKKIKH